MRSSGIQSTASLLARVAAIWRVNSTPHGVFFFRWRDRQKGQAPISTSDFDCRLIAVSESLRIFSIRGGKEREFLLKICGMLDRGDGHRDFFAISENGDWDIFVGG